MSPPKPADLTAMRFRTSLLMVLVAALAISAAAFAGNGSPRPSETAKAQRHACHGKRAVVLKGTFVAAATDSFTMNVRKANRHGRALRGEQSVRVDANTKLRRRGTEGQATLASFVRDDRLHVLARCTPGATAGSFTLLARLVIARPARAATPATG
jgi:hypothetical protein